MSCFPGGLILVTCSVSRRLETGPERVWGTDTLSPIRTDGTSRPRRSLLRERVLIVFLGDGWKQSGSHRMWLSRRVQSLVPVGVNQVKRNQNLWKTMWNSGTKQTFSFKPQTNFVVKSSIRDLWSTCMSRGPHFMSTDTVGVGSPRVSLKIPSGVLDI